ncbi:TlpA family protein disulfide reductase [Carboxylicivirga marina]|uniref:TlpA family protein disulfide reductase n=1 Tax=Carboxylicivirga marina TaxID=2800988 RepID=UPI00259410B4|nr:thioredoxin-like domain-containing protein [uncultured Carboxylicivirga sp.]
MKHYLFFLFALLLVACSKPQKTPYLTLKSNGKLLSNAELYILKNNYQLFDKAIIDEESKKLMFIKDSVPEGIYELRINNKPISKLIISGTLPFSISGNFNTAQPNLTINGNETTKALWKCQEASLKLENEINAISAHIPDSVLSSDYIRVRDSIYTSINVAINRKKKEINRVIKNHRNTLLPLLAVQLSAGNHKIYNHEVEADLIYEIRNQLVGQYGSYVPVNQFSASVDSIMNRNLFNALTKEGRILPSVSIPDAWGKNVLLDTLIHQASLLVLWKSDDNHSRIISKQLMRWTRSYRRQGLQVYMISFDNNREGWLEAIKQDRLALLHLSDLKGKESPLFNDFGLTNIPQLLLLDDKRVIVKRTQELEELKPAIQQLIKN